MFARIKDWLHGYPRGEDLPDDITEIHPGDLPNLERRAEMHEVTRLRESVYAYKGMVDEDGDPCIATVIVPRGAQVVVPVTFGGWRKTRVSDMWIAEITRVDTLAPIERGYSAVRGAEYEVGEKYAEPDFNTNTWDQCVPGLHVCPQYHQAKVWAED